MYGIWLLGWDVYGSEVACTILFSDHVCVFLEAVIEKKWCLRWEHEDCKNKRLYFPILILKSGLIFLKMLAVLIVLGAIYNALFYYDTSVSRFWNLDVLWFHVDIWLYFDMNFLVGPYLLVTNDLTPIWLIDIHRMRIIFMFVWASFTRLWK